MDLNYVKYNPSKFRLPPRNTCLLSNIYDIPCVNPSYKYVEQCSKKVENFENKNSNNNVVLQNSKYLWTFIEDNTPNYIKLNIESFNKFYNRDYNIIVLNKKNIYKYLPNLSFNLDSLDKIPMVKKIDYIKYNLLYNYGGLWIDSSVFIYKYLNFKKQSNKYDFIVFSNPNYDSCLSCNVLELPNTKIIYSKPKLDITKYLLNETCKNINKINSNYEFNNLSEKVLYDALKLYLSKNDCNQKYSNLNILVLPSYNIGKLTNNNKILLINDYLQEYKIVLKPNSFCTIIDNNENYYKSPYELFYYKMWFLKLKNELVNSSMFISYLYRLNN